MLALAWLSKIGFMAALVDLLIPTYNRYTALAVTLTSLIAQAFRDFRIIISDQSMPDPTADSPEVQAVVNVLRTHGNEVVFLRNLPRRGMAQQRQFLLENATAPYVLYLDDDVVLESYVLRNLVQTIQEQACGFVGSALAGLTYLNDERPEQQQIEFWDGMVKPEVVRPGLPSWGRHRLHNAANIYHLAQRLELSPDHPRLYKIAWIGGCVLYDTALLRSVGGFLFWKELPDVHAGEDVLAQLRVMDFYGGCGLIPSGVYHLQLPTTIPDRQVDAPKFSSIEVEKHDD